MVAFPGIQAVAAVEGTYTWWHESHRQLSGVAVPCVGVLYQQRDGSWVWSVTEFRARGGKRVRTVGWARRWEEEFPHYAANSSGAICTRSLAIV